MRRFRAYPHKNSRSSPQPGIRLSRAAPGARPRPFPHSRPQAALLARYPWAHAAQRPRQPSPPLQAAARPSDGGAALLGHRRPFSRRERGEAEVLGSALPRRARRRPCPQLGPVPHARRLALWRVQARRRLRGRPSGEPGDLHQLRDMRRSGVLEAFAGGGDRAVSEKFGNSIDRSSFLFRTYNPVDLEKVRQTDAARLEAAGGGTKADALWTTVKAQRQAGSPFPNSEYPARDSSAEGRNYVADAAPRLPRPREFKANGLSRQNRATLMVSRSKSFGNLRAINSSVQSVSP